MNRRFTSTISALALVAPLAGTATAAETRIGMLTCLAEAPPANVKDTWPVSCTFEPVESKISQRYQGAILGMVPSARRVGKALMQWAVVTDGGEVKAGDLGDTYTAGERAPERMVGERNKVILQPVTATEQGANIAQALRVMTLSLPKA